MTSNGSAERLRQHIEAVEHLNEEIAGLNTDKSERFALAKSEGFNVKAMKAIIKRRASDQGELELFDEEVNLYQSWLDGKPVGTPLATRARTEAAPPHDSETGEITEDSPIDRPGTPQGSAADPHPSCLAESPAPVAAEPNVNVVPAAASAVILATKDGNAAPTTDRAPATYLSPDRSRTGPAATATAEEQKLLGDIPAHLRRLN
jgi:uncharacterized protein (UPF0335 family)